MLGAELRRMLTRRRTWCTVALLAGLPVLVGLFLRQSGIAPRPGEGPALLSEVLRSGVLFPAAALALVLPIFLPVATAVMAGDTIAGEANAGTLRYLLIRPVSRTRLLVAKLVGVAVFVFLAVGFVVAVGFVAGGLLFGFEPISSISGSTLTTTDVVVRTGVTMVYVAVSMLGLASRAVFASTWTDSPLAAALAALATFVTSQVLDLIDATSAIQPFLPTHYWLAFIDLFRDPILWHEVVRGLGLQAVYLVVFLGAAWAHLATKDVTS